MALEKFCAVQSDLLGLERAAELAQAQEHVGLKDMKALISAGVCLVKLEVESKRFGFFGRLVVTLKAANKQPLPAHKITTGKNILLAFKLISINGQCNRVRSRHT